VPDRRAQAKSRADPMDKGQKDGDKRSPGLPPIYQGDEDANIKAAQPLPLSTGREDNRGHRAREGSGVVEGSGAAAGGGGNPEDYDSDPVSGGAAQQGQDDDDRKSKPQ
jgi:hypothetical protein